MLGCWGSFNDPEVCDYTYETMTEWGRGMYVTPGVVVDGKLVTTDLVDINLGMRILLGSSFYDDWQTGETFVKHDPLGNPVDQRHPWNQTTTPRPQKRDFGRQIHLGHVAALARPPKRADMLALDTGGGPLARFWVDGVGRQGRHGLRQGDRPQRENQLAARRPICPKPSWSGKSPSWSNTLERDRARTYFQAYAAAAALYFLEQAQAEVHAGRVEHVDRDTRFPNEAIGCGFHEAVRGVLSHHVVIRDGKIANYHPYPPTCWNASPRDPSGTPGPYEDAVQNTPIFEENGPDNFKGIDIMRAPCGASIPVCLAACTCISAVASKSKSCTLRCSVSCPNRKRRHERTDLLRPTNGRIEELIDTLEKLGNPVARAARKS